MFFADHPRRIALELDETSLGTYPLDGETRELQAAVLRSHFYLFGPPLNQKCPPQVCRIDTGAPLTVIPRRIWAPHDEAKRIEWLNGGDGRFITGIGGKQTPSRLGRVEFWLVDLNSRMKMMQCIIAECALDGQNGYEELPDTLLGLGGDAMRNAGLCINHADLQFWFVRAS